MMRADRYVKFILTVIALELLWLGLRDTAPPVLAQQEPTQVVIAGVRIDGQEYTTLPVAVVGGLRVMPGPRQLPNLETLRVRVPDPVTFDPRLPLTVQTGDRPLMVESVPAKPGTRPGLQ